MNSKFLHVDRHYLQGIVKFGSPEELRRALPADKQKRKAVVCVLDEARGGVSLLTNACWWGRFDMAEALVVEHGHPVDFVEPKYGITALHNACGWGRIEVVQFLIRKLGANPRAVNKDGLNALHCACIEGHLELARILVRDFRVNVDTPVLNGGRTPLIITSEKGHTATALSLLHLGARADAAGADDVTAVVMTAALGHTGTLLALINIGGARADLTVQGQTLLHVACSVGNSVTVSALLAEGACLDTKNVHGQKPQEVICLFPDAFPEDKPRVLAAIARHRRLERLGHEVLRLAATWDHDSLKRAIHSLMSAAAEPWACSEAVAAAAKKENWTAPRHPLDMFREPATGRTALAVAAAAGIFRNAELLIQAAASPLEPDCDGRTPWQLALARGSHCMSVWFESMPIVYWAGHSQLRYRVAATTFLLCCRFSRMRAPVQPVEEMGPEDGFIPGVTFMHPDDWCIPQRDAYRILHFLGPDHLMGSVWPGPPKGWSGALPGPAPRLVRRVPPRQMVSCALCATTAGRLMQCTRCRAAHYCSKKCQKLHYPEHKAGCRASGKG
jgi:ankyrin repeat protein